MGPELNQSETGNDQHSSSRHLSRRDGIVVILLCIPAILLLMGAHYVLFRWIWGGDSGQFESAIGAAIFFLSDLLVVVWIVPKVIKDLYRSYCSKTDIPVPGSPGYRRHAVLEIVGIGMLVTLVLGMVYALIRTSYYGDTESHRLGFLIFSSVAYAVAGVFYTLIRRPKFTVKHWMLGWIAAPAILMLPLLLSSSQKTSYSMTAWVLGTWVLNSASGLGVSLLQTHLDKE